MKAQYIIAYDLGTSGNKACLFDTEGRPAASAYQAYPTYYGPNGEAEQRPEDWWNSVVKTTREVMAAAQAGPEDVLAISFSAQVSAVVLVDRDGRLLQEKSMIWMDTRGKAQADRIERDYGRRRHYGVTGNCVDLTIMQVTKLMWLKENREELLSRAYRVLGAKEYVIMRLCGAMDVSDFAQIGAGGLYNVFSMSYEDSILDFTGIPRSILLSPAAASAVVGELGAQAAARLGLGVKTKVILGLADGVSSFLGAGGFRENVLMANFGTAVWLGLAVEGLPALQQEYQVGVGYLGGRRYMLDIHSHAGGAVTGWAVKNLLCMEGRDSFDSLERLAEQSPAGANGLFLNPSFIGGNGCYPFHHMKGAVWGLRLDSSRQDIARMVVEAPIFDLANCYDLYYRRHGYAPSEIRVAGGGGKSRLTRRILAGMFGLPVSIPGAEAMQHAGALGAFATACIGLGIYKDYRQAAMDAQSEEIVYPDGEDVAAYGPLIQEYRRFADSLALLYGGRPQTKEEGFEKC